MSQPALLCKVTWAKRRGAGLGDDARAGPVPSVLWMCSLLAVMGWDGEIPAVFDFRQQRTAGRADERTDTKYNKAADGRTGAGGRDLHRVPCLAWEDPLSALGRSLGLQWPNRKGERHETRSVPLRKIWAKTHEVGVVLLEAVQIKAHASKGYSNKCVMARTFCEKLGLQQMLFL